MIKRLLRIFALIIWYITKVLERTIMKINGSRFEFFGKNAIFHPFSTVIKGHENLYLGDFATIGPNSIVYCIDSRLIIGKKTGIGPGSIIITGNHSTHILGKFYKDYTLADKNTFDDSDVVIEEDVWIGAGCIILKGARIGRGSIIGAGSLINKEFPPYSIVYGRPGKVAGRRFCTEQIVIHEKTLYAPQDRISMETLQRFDLNSKS